MPRQTLPRRRRTPTMLQLEAVECGAAALAMILAAHGRWVPLDALRIACGVSRDGSRASHMLRAARGYGMEAKGFRLPPAALGKLALPAIIFVNRNHFMVLEEARPNRFFLNDPAGGRFDLDDEEFARMYSGIVLTFTPTPAFAPGGQRPRMMAQLLAWLGDSRAAVAHILLTGVALGLLGVVVPSFTRIFIDDYLIDGQAHWLPWLLGIMVAAALLQAGLTWLNASVKHRLGTRIATTAAARFVWRLMRLPVRFFGQRFAGSIANRATLAKELGGFAATEATTLAVQAIAALILFAIMLGYSPPLALVTLVCSIANLAFFLALRQRLQALRQKATLDEGKLQGRTMQGLQMMESLKATGGDDPWFEAWDGQHALVVISNQQIGRTEALFAALPGFIARSGIVLVLILGGWLVMQGRLTLGTLIAFRLLQEAFNAPVMAMVQAGVKLQGARGVIDQLDDILLHAEAAEFDTQPPTAAGSPGSLGAVHRLTGRVTLRGIAFGYNLLEKPLVEGFDLDLSPGSRVALVGASGSGKSTVGRLVTGLNEPWAGEIRLDGQPIAGIPRRLLRNSLAVVDQDIVLMAGTVRDNITLWDDTMPEAMVVAAAKDACIHDDIVRRPGGYDAIVEEAGRNFSGGQRQRLELARALVTGPTLLVLDEATSALDPVVEKQVMDNLQRRGCTLLIIAHRLSTVRDCDEIVVMERGEVLERGTHEGLLAQGGAYARLIEA